MPHFEATPQSGEVTGALRECVNASERQRIFKMFTSIKMRSGVPGAILAPLVFVLMIALAHISFSGENPVCSVCKKRIPPNKEYLVYGGNIFCGKNCYLKTMPACATCGKKSVKGLKNADGVFFCSEKCLSQTWPVCSLCGKRSQEGVKIGDQNGKFFCRSCAAKPKCFCCDMPDNCTVLADGRNICRECAKTSVTDEAEFIRIISDVKAKMEKEFKLSTRNDIKYSLVDLPTLQDATPGKATARMEFGTYKTEETVEKTIIIKGPSLFGKAKEEVKDEKKTTIRNIFLLSGLTKGKMTEVSAHELAHDWMQNNYPAIKDLKVKEGWAEFVAWRINKLFGNLPLNAKIEDNLDATYGDGFRAFKKLYDGGGEPAIMDFIKSSAAAAGSK